MSRADSVTECSRMPSSSNGSGEASGTPGQPTQAPWWALRIDSSAVTRPPGLAFQCSVPSASRTRSTGSLLATTTKSAPTSPDALPESPLTLLLPAEFMLCSLVFVGCLLGVLGIDRLRSDAQHVEEHAALLGVLRVAGDDEAGRVGRLGLEHLRLVEFDLFALGGGCHRCPPVVGDGRAAARESGARMS